ncbi:MAG: sugar phosphate isomerase/epimerase [Phycisphaerae bacterium]|nr:sugar phosphate isomerase/epimerase [Phycisphaerae bacterium]
MSCSHCRWRLGLQTYTFNRFTAFESLDKCRQLGIEAIEFYPGQALSPEHPDVKTGPELIPELRDLVKAKLAENGQTLVNCFGGPFGKDETADRRTFEFAKDMGIETLVCEIEPDGFDQVDRLVAEYDVTVAIHNHPKPSRYWSPDVVLDAIAGHDPRIGVCPDTGHYKRSGLDPVEAIRKLEGHIKTVHLKDITPPEEDAHDTIWGQGTCDARGILTELHRQGFRGVISVEYEYNWDDSVPDIARCAAFFQEVTDELYGQA